MASDIGVGLAVLAVAKTEQRLIRGQPPGSLRNMSTFF
jgi:hypothetical protein